MEKLLVSVSGGETSAYMAQLLKNNYRNQYEMIFVFANTGKERQETFDFINRIDKEFELNIVWIEAVINIGARIGTTAKIVNINNASRNGEPFEAMIKKYGMPNIKNPSCTRELKSQAIKSYARSIGWKKYYTAIGIRADEIDRVSPSASKFRYIYPLVSSNITKKDIIKYWDNMPFYLELDNYDGNCDLCFKKSFRKLIRIITDNPNVADWWRDMENKYKMYLPESHNQNTKLPICFFRGNTTVDGLFKIKRNYEKQLNMFIDPDSYCMSYLDESNGCSESCEPF